MAEQNARQHGQNERFQPLSNVPWIMFGKSLKHVDSTKSPFMVFSDRKYKGTLTQTMLT